MAIAQATSLRPYQQAALDWMKAPYSAKRPDQSFILDQINNKRALASRMAGVKKTLPVIIPGAQKPVRPRTYMNINPSSTSGSTTSVTQWMTVTNSMTSSVTNTAQSIQILKQQLSTLNASIIRGNEWIWNGDLSSPREHRLHPGRKYNLPDGSTIELDNDGNYVLEDKDAKIIRKSNRIREFNKYLNASDLLEDFIKYLGEMGVRRKELADLPVSLFIHWLIIQAAESDGDEIPQEEVLAIEQEISEDRFSKCLHCGSQISESARSVGARFCSGSHMDAHLSSVNQPTAEQQPAPTEQAALVD